MQAGKVELPVNIPTPIVLASLDGVVTPSQYGPTKQQVRFSTADGKALYVPTWVGDKIKAEGSRSIRLTKAQDAQRKVAWHVEKLEAGEQSNGTFVIPKEKAGSVAPEPTSAYSTTSSSRSNHITPTIHRSESARKLLWDAGRELIDAQAALSKYAEETHGAAVTRADVRAVVLTVFIQMGRAGFAGGRR